VCLCAEITSIDCGVEIIVLRHTLEAKRNSNTGRLVARALTSARLVTYGAPNTPLETAVLTAPGTALLFPRPSAIDAPPPSRVIVLDGSWSQARRMAQRIPQLRGMPSLSLPAPTRLLPRMREGKSPEQMSTAESAIAALRVLGEEKAAAHLESLLHELVRRFALPKRKGPMLSTRQ
tara:strand:+ start:8791 stop:9321 length:531 start_codon:yes stop_codon:yes gene_type:complete